jgi:hypothetical protein
MLLIEIIPSLSWLHGTMTRTRPSAAGTKVVFATARLARPRVAITYYPKYEHEYC